jgi:hypothetical protein
VGWKSATPPPLNRLSTFAPVFGADVALVISVQLPLFDLPGELERIDRNFEVIAVFGCHGAPQLEARRRGFLSTARQGRAG